MNNPLTRLLALGGLSLLALAWPAPGAVDFGRDVRPLLERHCLECHGPKQQKSGYRLDVREVAMRGGDSGRAAIVPHDAANSPLLRYVSGADPEMIMPPPKSGKPRLTEAEVALLRTWIEAGPAWPEDAAGTVESFSIAARKAQWPWIWQVPRREPVPAGPGATAVDRFLNARLQAQGLTAAPPADGRVWLRRVHFALTGLPPTREAMQAFRDTPGERARVVDALLASPHFGERWARHWMDVVRYAESRGHEDDYPIANAWRYRDYLVRAFNADVPYDRFVAEHIAGDLLPPRRGPGGVNESVLGTGWAFLGEEIHNPVDIRQDECERVDNKVDVLSKAFLGLTVSCARCHDHKFDALSQRDYYALAGFVLGSPFRQVRFETMLAHEEAATRLAALRAARAPAVAAAFREALQPTVPQSAAHLLAAQRVLAGEGADAVAADTGLAPARVAAWHDQLRQAAADPAHPLHLPAKLAREPAAGYGERFAALRAGLAAPGPALGTNAMVIADYTAPGRTPWKVDGPAFGLRPALAGEVLLDGPTNLVARVLPHGAAVRDPFWNPLTLAAGNEMDSGQLGAARRAGRTLLTPKFTLASGKLHYLIRGQAKVYAGVDSHIMLVGGLHDRLIANFNTRGELQWVTHDLSGYQGHRTHLEFTPQVDAPLEVLMVVDAPQPPTWRPSGWRPPATIATPRALAGAFEADLGLAVNALGSNVPPDLAALAGWAVRNAALLGADLAPVPAAAATFLSEQEALAKTIRWDSATAVSWTDATGVDEAVLIRGKPTRPGATAPRGLPEAFGTPRITVAHTSGRAELARQLTDPANPLVARVLVNRVWHHLFGRGLVPTPDNFGQLGERPTHPELLDYLAWQFVHEDGWSMKTLIRQLVLTDAFARSSRDVDPRAGRVDPANLLLHRYPVRRLEAEAIRDSLLVVSGRFDPKLGGPPVPVHLTDFIVGRGRPATSGPLDGAGRRSLYLSARRNFLPTFLLAFDLPTPFSTVGRRNVTNVPAQALALMNDPFVREQAGVWAARLLKETPGATDEARVAWLFETAFTRPPAAGETRAALETLAELRALHAGAPPETAWAEFCHALPSVTDFIYLP